MSLADCLKKSSFFKDTEKLAMIAKSEEYQKSGMSKQEADKKVVEEEINSVHANMKSVYEQLGKQYTPKEPTSTSQQTSQSTSQSTEQDTSNTVTDEPNSTSDDKSQGGSQPPVDNGIERPEVEEPGKGKRRLFDRAYRGRTSAEVKKAMERLGFDRDRMSNAESEKAAKEFVEYAGHDEAIKLVREGKVRGQMASHLWAKAIDSVGEDFEKATPEQKEKIAEAQASMLNEFDNFVAEAGREIQALAEIYKVSPLGYAKYVRKKVEKINGKEKKRFQKKIDALTKSLNDAVKENADLLIELKELEDKINNKPKSKSKRKAELAEKFKDRFRALQKLGDDLFLESNDPGNPNTFVSHKDLGITGNETVKEVIEKLAKVNSELKPILEYILRNANFGDLRFHLYEKGKNEAFDDIVTALNDSVAGLFLPRDYGVGSMKGEVGNTIMIHSKQSSNFYYDFVHELMHWHTVENIGEVESILGEKLQKSLKSVFNYIVERKPTTKGKYVVRDYGLSNYKEFLAELLINPYLRDYVSDVQFDDDFDGNEEKLDIVAEIIKKISDIVKKIFGKKVEKASIDTRKSALDNAVDLMERIYFGGIKVSSRSKAFGGNQALSDLSGALAVPAKSNEETVVFHGGGIKSLDDIDSYPFFVTEEEDQAQLYKDGGYPYGDGNLVSFKIGENEIIDEEDAIQIIQDLGLESRLKNDGYEVDALNLYELIDPNFSTSISKSGLNKFKKELAKRGVKAIRFLDYNLKSGRHDIYNIAVYDKSVLKEDISLSIDLEKKSIISNAKEEGTYLLAPNGEKTKLTEDQWVTVRTKNFKDWFGDWENDPENASKVVDENFEPMVVYHGTDSKFNVFKSNSAKGWGSGIYFTDNKSQSSEFGENIIDSFVNIRNPITDKNINSTKDDVEKTTAWERETNKRREKYDDSEFELDFGDELQEGISTINSAWRELGFDGVISDRSNNVNGLEVVAFSPNQIKSATANSGAFNPNDNRIYAMASRSQDVLGDPEFMEYAKLMAEDKSFKDFSKEMISNVGEGIKPYLKDVYAKSFSRTPESIRKQIETGRKKLQKAALENLSKVKEDMWDDYENYAVKAVSSKVKSSLSKPTKKQKAILDNFVEGMIKNIVSNIKKENDAPEKRSTPLEIVSDSFKNREKYEQVLDKAYDKLISEISDINDLELIKLHFEGNIRSVFSEQMLTSVVNDGMVDVYGKGNVGKEMLRLAREYYLQSDKEGKSLADFLVEKGDIPSDFADGFARDIEEEFNKKLNAKILSELDRTFKNKTTKKNIEKKNKVVEAINIGLKTDFRKDGTPFNLGEELFSMLGLINTNDPNVKAKLDAFAKRIYENKDPQNKLFQTIAEIELEDWLANHSKESRILNGLVTQLYANMLYGIDTHVRNTTFNIQKLGLSLLRSIAQEPRYSKQIIKAFASNLGRGIDEAVSIMKTGMPKSGDDPRARNFAERAAGMNKTMEALSKYWRIPGRTLAAMDAALNFANTNQKAVVYLINELKKSHPEMTRKEITEQVEMAFFGEDKMDDIRAKAEKQVMTFYRLDSPLFDEDGKKTYDGAKYKNIYRDYRRSVANLMDAQLSDDIREKSKEYAALDFMFATPRGYAGAFAAILNHAGEYLPILKATNFPFINVPFNMASFLFEFSPAGFLSIIAKREGFGIPEKALDKAGIKYEIDDQRKRDLLFNAITGTIGMAAVYALSQMTYFDDDEKVERPILIVTADGLGNYQENQKLERLKGSLKFTEYTVDFMGARFSYKSSPFASWFLPAGYLSDYTRYGKESSEDVALRMIQEGKTEEEIESMLQDNLGVSQLKTEDAIEKAKKAGWFDDRRNTQYVKAVAGYFVFMKDQSSLSGLSDLLNIGTQSRDEKEGNFSRSVQRRGAAMMRSLLFPNMIPQVYRHYKAAEDEAESRGRNFQEYLTKDIPFLDDYTSKSFDHFGDLIKSKSKVPGIWSEGGMDSKEYQLCFEKGYLQNLRHFYQTSVDYEGRKYDLTEDQIYQIAKLIAEERGKVLREQYDSFASMNNKDFATTMKQLNGILKKNALDVVLGGMR